MLNDILWISSWGRSSFRGFSAGLNQFFQICYFCFHHSVKTRNETIKYNAILRNNHPSHLLVKRISLQLVNDRKPPTGFFCQADIIVTQVMYKDSHWLCRASVTWQYPKQPNSSHGFIETQVSRVAKVLRVAINCPMSIHVNPCQYH